MEIVLFVVTSLTRFGCRLKSLAYVTSPPQNLLLLHNFAQPPEAVGALHTALAYL